MTKKTLNMLKEDKSALNTKDNFFYTRSIKKKQPMLTCKHFITLSPQLRASSSKSCSCSVCLQPSAHLNWVIEQPSRRSTEEAAEKTSTES